MLMPDDIDDAYEHFLWKSAQIDAALELIEAEQAKGRSGHAAVLRAESLAEDLKQFAALLAKRIAEARGAL